jgi:hypothetical protein
MLKPTTISFASGVTCTLGKAIEFTSVVVLLVEVGFAKMREIKLIY